LGGKTISKPLFVLSADFELLWPCNNQTTRKAIYLIAHQNRIWQEIYALLHILERYDIPSTQAIAGHLCLDRCETHDSVLHPHMSRLEGSSHWRDPCINIKRHPLFYKKDIVQRIVANPVENERGYHMFSYMPFSECDRAVTEEEIVEGLKIASEYSFTLRSFVFARNRVRNVDVLKAHHYEIYKGPNRERKHIDKTLLQRTQLYFFTHLVPPPVQAIWREDIWGLLSSMKFYCVYGAPFSSALPFRDKKSVVQAKKESKIFHISINLGDLVASRGLLDKFEQMLAFFSKKEITAKLRRSLRDGLPRLSVKQDNAKF
jgi:hypothetical protein